MRQYRIALRALSTGALTLGLLQAFQDVNFNVIWFTLLTTFFQVLMTALFGGDANALFST